MTKPRPHCSPDPNVKTSEQLLSRLSLKEIAIENEDVESTLLESLGYTHIVRYVPTHAARIASLGKNIPIWSALEFSSLGTVSKFFSNLTTCDAKRSTAMHYKLDTSFIESWLFSLSFVRNECAHGGVLYGRDLEIQPRTHKLFPHVSNRRAFYQVLMLSWVLERDISHSGKRLVDDYVSLLSHSLLRAGVGAPEGWESMVKAVACLAADGTERAARPC